MRIFTGRNKALNITVLWYATTCSLLDVYRCFIRKCCLNFQEQGVYLRSSEISVSICQNIWSHIAEENDLQNHVHENLRLVIIAKEI
jgi:uncharacterized membrane protein YobD (UPF0266 family)